MILPGPADFIDIHTHGLTTSEGAFTVENIMAHESANLRNLKTQAFTAGIHPWYLQENSKREQLDFIRKTSRNPDLIAIGEAGFDKLRGASMELQRSAFEEQVYIAEEVKKPVVIHCVRAWDELLSSHKNLKPKNTWLVHGFRGKKELASQLLSKGMYISPWFEFALRSESASLLRFMPRDRIFLETDGADVSIGDIYRKVASDLTMDLEELKRKIFENFMTLFPGKA